MAVDPLCSPAGDPDAPNGTVRGFPVPGPNPGAAAVPRPDSHRGHDILPPLRPCADARTPTEAMTLPRNDSLGVDDEGTSSGGNPTANACGANASDDVFARLRSLQQADDASAGPQRHWGDNERHARTLLEDFACACENRTDVSEASGLVEDALSRIDPRAIDDDGFALLHYASMNGSVEGVAALIRKRASLNSRTKVHETALTLAAFYRHADVVALLLAHKSRTDLADWQGRTPLAAAKASLCGNGSDNNGQAQAQCVRILSERVEANLAAGSPKEVEDMKKQGNAYFQQGEWKEAIAAYSIGLSFEDHAGLYNNRAACYMQLNKYLEAKLDAQKAVGLSGDSGNKKASWRLAKAALALGELDRADEALVAGLRQFAGDPALRQLKNEVALERRKRLNG